MSGVGGGHTTYPIVGSMLLGNPKEGLEGRLGACKREHRGNNTGWTTPCTGPMRKQIPVPTVPFPRGPW